MVHKIQLLVRGARAPPSRAEPADDTFERKCVLRSFARSVLARRHWRCCVDAPPPPLPPPAPFGARVAVTLYRLTPHSDLHSPRALSARRKHAPFREHTASSLLSREVATEIGARLAAWRVSGNTNSTLYWQQLVGGAHGGRMRCGGCSKIMVTLSPTPWYPGTGANER